MFLCANLITDSSWRVSSWIVLALSLAFYLHPSRNERFLLRWFTTVARVLWKSSRFLFFPFRYSRNVWSPFFVVWPCGLRNSQFARLWEARAVLCRLNSDTSLPCPWRYGLTIIDFPSLFAVEHGRNYVGSSPTATVSPTESRIINRPIDALLLWEACLCEDLWVPVS